MVDWHCNMSQYMILSINRRNLVMWYNNVSKENDLITFNLDFSNISFTRHTSYPFYFSHSRACCRSSHPEVFLVKGVLKICSKFTGEHPCRSVISIMLQGNFIEIILRRECSPVNLLHIFKTTFTRNTFGRLLLMFIFVYFFNQVRIIP